MGNVLLVFLIYYIITYLTFFFIQIFENKVVLDIDPPAKVIASILWPVTWLMLIVGTPFYLIEYYVNKFFDNENTNSL